VEKPTVFRFSSKGEYTHRQMVSCHSGMKVTYTLFPEGRAISGPLPAAPGSEIDGSTIAN
jgi:hypothetical protein